MMKKILAILLIVLSVFSLVSCKTTDSSDNKPTSSPSTSTPSTPSASADDDLWELVVNVGPDPDTIDPALNSAVDGATLIIHAFEGLYSLDENGTPIPGAAESVDISADGLVYTFHLRDDLKWSDGSELNAFDFVYSWNRAIDEDLAADYEYMFESIEGYEDGELEIEAVDATTLTVKLIARTPYFLELTAFPTFYPVKEDIVESNGDAWATKVDTYVGNGPYTMIEWVPGSHIKYAKNEYYWNYDALGPDEIKFVLMDDDNAMLAAYMAEELAFIDTVPNDEIEALRGRSDFFIAGQLGTYYISYNCEVAPFDNPEFRKALTLAIDRDYITKNIGKSGQQNAGAYVATGIGDFVPGVEFRDVGGDYYDPSAEAFEANLAEAKAIIEKLYPNGNVPSFTYIYNESTGHALIAQALQQMWGELGIDVLLEAQEWATFLNTRKNGEYQV
ncbi:MAG: peptide ABC transporter substrate-binding protein, partial [Oscillospiraceae bacterium]|nr:peptide ABC transporter substrate-binding protein [Oscillospiraceae bacterium]